LNAVRERARLEKRVKFEFAGINAAPEDRLQAAEPE